MTTGKWLTAQFFDGLVKHDEVFGFSNGRILAIHDLCFGGTLADDCLPTGHSCHVRYVDICAEVMVLMDRQVVDLPTGREHFGDV